MADHSLVNKSCDYKISPLRRYFIAFSSLSEHMANFFPFNKLSIKIPAPFGIKIGTHFLHEPVAANPRLTWTVCRCVQGAYLGGTEIRPPVYPIPCNLHGVCFFWGNKNSLMIWTLSFTDGLWIILGKKAFNVITCLVRRLNQDPVQVV